MLKKRTIDSFFIKNFSQTNTSLPNLIESSIVDNETFEHEEERLAKASRLDGKEVDINSLKCDPGKRPPMWSYSVNQQDKIRQAYIKIRQAYIKILMTILERDLCLLPHMARDFVL